jgi:hypothetical protein
MATSTFDSCLLYEKTNPTKGLVGMQTDDTLILATPQLADQEEAELVFASKPRKELTPESPILFNGATISLTRNGAITVLQSHQVSKLRLVKPNTETTAQDYIAQRARGAYIATVSQPESAFGLSYAA